MATNRHEIEIEIMPNGEVKVEIRGIKGKKCVTYAKQIANIVGKIKEEKFTNEFYEPESEVGIVNIEKVKKSIKNE